MITASGKRPDAQRREAFNSLSNFKNGQFENLIHTPPFAEGTSMTKAMRDFLRTHPDTRPPMPVPHMHTDLQALDRSENVLIWFGHSSYFLQVDGFRILIDPVFSGNASPIPGSIKAFEGSNYYQAHHMPDIDLLLISHDHWDHLDYPTIQRLKPKVKQVVCGLGVAQHFEYWGWDKNIITEKNWFEEIVLNDHIRLTVTPARHFSGRLFKRNVSLWVSYVLEVNKRRYFLGGDSGHGPHFAQIGKQFGSFDLAILECGQYNTSWPYIHSMPEEILTQVNDLGARHLMIVHHSKFKLAHHPWNEPLQRVSRYAAEAKLPMSTPMIGEKLALDLQKTDWVKWWEF